MGVSVGSPVSASNTNQAFLDANADDVALGRIGLGNTLSESGSTVNNVQKELNSNSSFTGKPLNSAKDVLPSYVNNDVGVNGDTLQQRADLLTQKFNNTTGHKHTGAAGDAPAVESSDVANVKLHGYYLQAINITGITGSSVDVSLQFNTSTPSSSSTVKGVVVNAPYNVIVIKYVNGDRVEDGSGNEVYGRLTYSSPTWTLSFYSMVSGVETAFSFSVASDLSYWFQQLFNPIADAPVYSELTTVQSSNSTADIIDASETLAGKVLLANAAPGIIAATGAKGSSTRAAKADHTHQGVASVFKTGDSNVYGDIELSVGPNATLTRSGNKFTFDALGGVGYQETPGGVVNGVNTTFGPLTFLPSDANSVIVFIDGVAREKSYYTVSGYNIIFNSGFQPNTGQDVYVFYITTGVPALPPTPTGTLKTEFRTLTSLEASNKIVVLALTPYSPSEVLVDIIGGTAQEFNVDYTIVGNEFRWNGYALDGVLTSGDKIRFHYIT